MRRQSSAASRNARHLRYPLGTRAPNKRLVDGKRASTTSKPLRRLLGNPGPTTTPPVDTPNGGGPSGPAALKVTMSIRRGKLAAILAKGLRVTSRCSTRCKVKGQVRLDRKTARRLKLKALVGQRVGTATGNARSELTIEFSVKTRKALKRLRGVSFTILLTGREAQGNATTPIRRTVTLKR